MRAFGLLQRHAWLQPSHRLEVVPLVGRVRIELEERPTLRRRTELAEIEIAEHADDRVRLAAERDALADDVRIGVEPRFPQTAVRSP